MSTTGTLPSLHQLLQPPPTHPTVQRIVVLVLFAPLILIHSWPQNPCIRFCFKLQHKLQRVLATFVLVYVFLVHGCQYTFAGSAWLVPLPEQLCPPCLNYFHAPLAHLQVCTRGHCLWLFCSALTPSLCHLKLASLVAPVL